MCGIVGLMNKRNGRSELLGRMLLGMLRALGCRGPDSAGVALFGDPVEGWVLQIKLPEDGDARSAADRVCAAAADRVSVEEVRITGPYLRLVVQDRCDCGQLEAALVSAVAGVEVISLGSRMEI